MSGLDWSSNEVGLRILANKIIGDENEFSEEAFKDEGWGEERSGLRVEGVEEFEEEDREGSSSRC